MPRVIKPGRHNRGSALLLTLMIVAILSILAMGIVTRGSSGTDATGPCGGMPEPCPARTRRGTTS